MLSSAAFAQQSLYDTSFGELGVGESKASIVLIPFNDNESSLYSNLSWTYGLTDRIWLQVRGATASKETVNGGGGAVRTGGSDLEFRVMTRSEQLFLALGASLPDTPAQDQVAGTFQGGLIADFEDGGQVVLALTGVTSEDVTLVGFGAGLSKALKGGLSLDASATFLVRGENTVNLGSLNREREPLFGLGLSYKFDEDVKFRIGYGNSVGTTTGFALSPRLGAGGGLYFGAEVKF